MDDVTPTHAYPGLGSRAGAFCFDYLLISGYMLVLGMGSTLVLHGPLRERIAPFFNTPIRRDLGAFLVLIVPVILYSTYAESSSQAATWGKQKRGLQVLDGEGNRLSRVRAFARAALKFLPWQVAHTSLFHIPGWPLAVEDVPNGSKLGLGLVWIIVGIYGVSMLIHPQHRTIYDQIVGSSVQIRPDRAVV